MTFPIANKFLFELYHSFQILRAEVIKLYGETSDLVEDLPSTYELYNDLILVPSQCLRKCDQSPEVFALICDIFRNSTNIIQCYCFKLIFPHPVSEFNEFKPRLKSAKKRFQLSACLNLETLNTILSGTNHI